MIAIIDSGGANIASVRFALARLGVDSVLPADPAVISAAERVILPGVGLTVPHMGGTRLLPQGEGRHPLLSGVEDGAHVYFVHSYAAPVSADTVASCSYGVDFTALVARGNFMGAQFHPERSGPVGARILGNFLALPAGGKG